MHEQIAKRLREVPANDRPLSRSDFTLTNGTASERSKVAEFKADRPFALREDERVRLALVTHESFTTDGTGGNTETFSLSHDVVDAGSTAEPLAVFKNGTAADEDSVDFSGDTFDFTDSGSSNTLDVYYTVGPGDQCQVEIEKAAPKDVTDGVWTGDIGLVNARDQDKQDLTLDFDHPLDRIVPKNWYIRVYADGPYAVEWSESTNSTSAPNALLTLPIRQSQENIEGLHRAVRHRIADK